MKKVKSTVIILLVILAFLSFTLIGNNVLNQNAIAGQSEEITLRLGQ